MATSRKDPYRATDLAATTEILTRHLAGRGFTPEQIQALGEELIEARPIMQDMVDEDYIAQQMRWSIASARTARSRWGDAFPKPLMRRTLWKRAEVDAFLEKRLQRTSVASEEH